MANKNGVLQLLKIVAIALGIAATAGALMRTYIVGPVKDTAERVAQQCDANTEKIHAAEKEIVAIKKDVEDIPEIKADLKRFMRDHGTPPTDDVPVGDHPADK